MSGIPELFVNIEDAKFFKSYVRIQGRYVRKRPLTCLKWKVQEGQHFMYAEARMQMLTRVVPLRTFHYSVRGHPAGL